MSSPFTPESRTIEGVQSSTRFLLESFKTKLAQLEESRGDVKQLLRFGVNFPSACSTAESFFGKEEIEYIAIDGTDSVDQQLDLIVFYVGAFGYSGNIKFLGKEIVVSDPKQLGTEFSVSAAIPISEEDAANIFGQKTQSGIEVDPQRLPGALMHLAEYYLAFKATTARDALKIIILDRTIAGDHAHLNWSTKDLIEDHLCILEGMETKDGVIDNFDLQLARMLLPNKELKIPAPRSHLVKYAAIEHLFDGQLLNLQQLIGRLGANQNRFSKLQKDFGELENEHHIFQQVMNYKLKDRVSKYWDRVLEAAHIVADHIFNPQGDHPLRFKKKGQEFWITADDIDFLTLIFVQALTRKAWTDNLLLIGLIKDIAAAELVKTVIPILQNAGKIKLNHKIPDFRSDKMLLQMNSVINSSEVPTPWHTIETDAAFKTMAPVKDTTLPKGEARVNGAFKNVIYPERMYVKTYIQLWSSKKNPAVRSHVFSYDRPAYPAYDHWDEILLHNEDSKVDEKIRPILHFERGSEMTNLAMAILVQMSKEVIPEAIGHNYPLFLADKKAKANLGQNREAYLAVVALEMSRSDLDQQVLFSSRFRDYRSKIEAGRKS
ncbi:MAG: hypothetical protein FJ358_06080 [Thaumarchaeota archaeon]|nr:hypothetical protein [Nitrososphaerota archaeon]